MAEYTMKGLEALRGAPAVVYYRYRDKLPLAEVIREAERRVRWGSRLAGVDQVRVRVFKVGKKQLLVLRVGTRFVSAFTWDRLIRKAAFGPWQRITDVTLAKRWR
jgi:hypothetical protein